MTWIAILFVARRVGRFLVRTESLFWMGLGVTEATAGLFVLSVVIVPLVVYLHAHLYWRDRLSLVAHVGVGSVVPLLILLIADIALPHLEVAPSPLPTPITPVWLSLLVAGGLGGMSSGLVRSYVIGLLRTRDAEIVRTFD